MVKEIFSKIVKKVELKLVPYPYKGEKDYERVKGIFDKILAEVNFKEKYPWADFYWDMYGSSLRIQIITRQSEELIRNNMRILAEKEWMDWVKQ